MLTCWSKKLKRWGDRRDAVKVHFAHEHSNYGQARIIPGGSLGALSCEKTTIVRQRKSYQGESE